MSYRTLALTASGLAFFVPLQAPHSSNASMVDDVEQGSATTPRSPREVRPPTPEQIRAAHNKLPETPAAPPPKDPRNLDYDENCHCCLRIGATWLICGKKRGRWPLQWFVGPDWCCMLCTYTLVLVPTVAFIIFIGEHHWAARYGAVLTGGATLVAFSSAACSDPGIVYREAGQEDTGGDVHSCRRCDVIRPHEARHCYECQVCVDDLDHHCLGRCGNQTVSRRWRGISTPSRRCRWRGASEIWFPHRSMDGQVHRQADAVRLPPVPHHPLGAHFVRGSRGDSGVRS